jgi:hypothetical protein
MQVSGQVHAPAALHLGNEPCTLSIEAVWNTMWTLQSMMNLGLCFYFLNHIYTVGRTSWAGDQPVARPLPTYRTNAETSMPRVGFIPTIPTFERSKTVHALDSAASNRQTKRPRDQIHLATIICVCEKAKALRLSCCTKISSAGS